MSGSASPIRVGSALIGLLMAAAGLSLAAAFLSLYFSQDNTPTTGGGSPAPIDALYGLAIDAEGIVAGNQTDLTSFQGQFRQIKDAAAATPSASFAKDARFGRLLSNATTVVEAKGPLTDAGNAARETRDLVPRLITEMGAITGNLPGGSLEVGTRALERFELRAQRLQLDTSALASGGATDQAAQHLTESNEYLGQVIQGLQGGANTTGMTLPKVPSGPETEKRIKALDTIYSDLNSAVRHAVAAAPAVPAAQSAARDVITDARALANAERAAAEPTVVAPTRVPAWISGVLLLIAVALLVAGMVVTMRVRKTLETQRQTVETQRRETDRNQQAILRLLDELSSLADGDLTVQATVTEDITGAIADSINYAVDALRGLVTTINQSAIQLDSATRQTQALSQHLAKASGAQSKQISSATESAGSMASSVEEVSGNAERAADVARHSVEVAHKGGDAVRRTIDGMNTIRETIQDTSKRIKRLGESSQEIGNIVELINDIAEQTNILALNASIQASMAGDAGRGFAVVADEVQRLAERAANATKQIEVLVRTIQTDTNEAVVSMERSTTDVVGGALLAENAGAALEEIEQVSNQIASLVQNISGSARQQTGGAQNIARNMQVLKEISVQTAESTNATSAAIAKLAELSAGLRKAAAGFRLPGTSTEAVGSTGAFKRLDETANRAAAAVPPGRPITALGGT
jgi:twitching motility protein PilJ